MDELRTDPITGRKVFISEGRAARPSDFIAPNPSQAEHSAAAETCPFCAGVEDRTPKPTHVVYDEHEQWQVRVIPNKFPAVTTQPPAINQRSAALPFSLPTESYGAHEVIIEAPQHVRDITEVSVDHLATVMQVYHDRLKYWADFEQMQFVQVFKNYGYPAGASLEHVHSQVLALPFVPATVESELSGASRYYQQNQRCVFCDLINQELELQTRVVQQEGPFAAICAYAGRQPYETWIMPIAHQADFRQFTDEESFSFATILHQLLKKLHLLLPQLSYNLILHTVPFSDFDPSQYHWHLEIVPRSTRLAGFEWGTGLFINPLSPESAAKILRETKV